MLTTAISAGVVSTFGTPFGAIVFSIELCTAVYLLSSLFKSFVCAAIGGWIFNYVHSFNYFPTIEKMELANPDNSLQAMLHFIMVGILCGYAGSFLIYLSSQCITAKRGSSIEFITK